MTFYLYDRAGRLHAATVQEISAHGCTDCTHTKALWRPLCKAVGPGDLNFANENEFGPIESFESDVAGTPEIVAGDPRVKCKPCQTKMAQKTRSTKGGD